MLRKYFFFHHKLFLVHHRLRYRLLQLRSLYLSVGYSNSSTGDRTPLAHLADLRPLVHHPQGSRHRGVDDRSDPPRLHFLPGEFCWRLGLEGVDWVEFTLLRSSDHSVPCDLWDHRDLAATEGFGDSIA